MSDHPPMSPMKEWFYTTDHKKIGLLYLWTSFFFFFVGGLLAILVRWELMSPGETIMSAQDYYWVFSMHGTTMIFLWIIPVLAGFGNYFLPLLVGAPDMAYPRLNALSYWTFLAAGMVLYFSVVVWTLVKFGVVDAANAPGVAAVGWTGYPPLSSAADNVGVGTDFWILGLHLVGVSSMMGAVNFIVTTFRMRGAGITLHNMSIFVWAQIITAFLITFATPMIGNALMLNFFDRNFGTTFFAGGDPILYQHLFWFYSHPAVYVMILPAMGIVSEVLPRMVKRPIFGYHAMVYSISAIAFLGFMVWAHHMFTTGIDPRARMGFMLMTMIIGVPTGVKIFNWIATIWGGEMRFRAVPFLWCVGFISMFLIGGIDGVYMASIPVDYQLHDTYWVVAHIHYVLFGGSVLGVFAGIYYWWPRMAGRMYNNTLAHVHFWMTLVGLNIVFMTMHLLGTAGMPRRVYDYREMYTNLNMITSMGAFLLGAGQIPFLWNVIASLKSGKRVTRDPWNEDSTIEWRTFTPKPATPGLAAAEHSFEKSHGGVEAAEAVVTKSKSADV